MPYNTIVTYPDTGINTYSVKLNQAIRALAFPFLEELKLCKRENIVLVADKMISDKVDELIGKIDMIPSVVIGRGSKVGIKDIAEEHLVVLTPKDGTNPIQLNGFYTNFYGDLQIVVIARNQATAIEIAKVILQFNTQWKKTEFDAIFQDLKGDKFICKNLSTFKLMATKEHEFSDSVDKDIGLSVMAVEYEYSEMSLRLNSKEHKPITGMGICNDS